MSDVQRWHLTRDIWADCSCWIEESESGHYVEYDDYEELEQRIEKLDIQVFNLESVLRLQAERIAEMKQRNAELEAAIKEFFLKETGGAVEAYAAKDRLRRLVFMPQRSKK